MVVCGCVCVFDVRMKILFIIVFDCGVFGLYLVGVGEMFLSVICF